MTTISVSAISPTEGPHCHVPAAFDPVRHHDLEQQLRRLVQAASWLEREVMEQRDCHATLAQAVVLEAGLREVTAQLIEGHLRYCVVGAVDRGQSGEEVARLLAPLQSVLFASRQ